EVRATGDIEIDASATVRARLEGRGVAVRGNVTGDVVAWKRLSVHGSGALTGDVRTPRLRVDDGTVVNGAISMRAEDATKGETAANHECRDGQALHRRCQIERDERPAKAGPNHRLRACEHLMGEGDRAGARVWVEGQTSRQVEADGIQPCWPAQLREKRGLDHGVAHRPRREPTHELDPADQLAHAGVDPCRAGHAAPH